MQFGLSSALTFGELQLRLAIDTDLAVQGTGADNRPQIPTDPNTLYRIKLAINNAARELQRRHRWSWLTPFISRTLSTDGTGPHNVAGDPHRYILPANAIGAPVGRMRWRNSDGSAGGKLSDSNIEHVSGLIDTSPSTVGVPMYCSVWHSNVNIGVGDVPQMQLVIWPKPDQAYTIQARFRCTVLDMTIDSERGMWGALHDQTILKLAKMMMMSSVEPGYTEAKREAEEAILISIERDREAVAKRLPNPDFRYVRPNRTNVYDSNGNAMIEYN